MMKESFGIFRDVALIQHLERNVSKNRRIRENFYEGE